MRAKKEIKLTNRRVKSVFKKCMLQDDEITFTETEIILPLVAEGINASYGLSKNRVEEMTSEIELLIDQLPCEIENGVSFKSCFNDKKGERWTSDEETLEMLLVLGVAANCIKYLIPKHYWHMLPDTKPFVIKK